MGAESGVAGAGMGDGRPAGLLSLRKSGRVEGLAGNLTLVSVNNDAIQITANNVTLDLNGFTISGPITCTTGLPFKCSTTGTGIGIQDPTRSRSNITMRNGTV